MKTRPTTPQGSSRRRFLSTATLAAASSPAILSGAPHPLDDLASFKIQNNRIHQSIMGWTFNPMPTMELARHCKDIGLVAMEGVGSEHYAAIRQLGLEISLGSSHGFAQGPLNPANHDTVETELRKGIQLATQYGFNKVITFTGMREPGISDETAIRNCVECWKRVIPEAEKQGVTLCLEHLNSRDNSHPMKGHPGYFGDNVDLCVDLIRKVDSPNMKLLFDIYHVQIMHGDVIRRIRKYHDVIAHVHTAGNPGRAELDDTQEIHYPGVLNALLDTGYNGYVAQEFIPTWPDPILALRHAARTCDI